MVKGDSHYKLAENIVYFGYLMSFVSRIQLMSLYQLCFNLMLYTVTILVVQNLSKPYLLGTILCVRNRQVFGLCRLFNIYF